MGREDGCKNWDKLVTQNREVEGTEREEGWMAVGGKGTEGSEGTKKGESPTGQDDE